MGRAQKPLERDRAGILPGESFALAEALVGFAPFGGDVAVRKKPWR